MSDKPQTPRTYGGRFTQTTEDKSCCVAGVWCDVRRVRFQCKHKRGKGPDGLYCGIHNPEARAEKQRKRDAVREAERKFQLDNSPLTIALRRAEKAEAEVERLKGMLGELQEDNMWLQVVQGNLRAIMREHQKDCPNCRGKGTVEVPYDSADLNDTSTVTEDCKQCARLRSALEAKP